MGGVHFDAIIGAPVQLRKEVLNADYFVSFVSKFYTMCIFSNSGVKYILFSTESRLCGPAHKIQGCCYQNYSRWQHSSNVDMHSHLM